MNADALFQYVAQTAREQFKATGQEGPRPCCGEYGIVTEVLGEPTQLYCGICHRTWTEPFPFQPNFIEFSK